MELSRLYGVSVDELLSLEEAEKGDAKAASSVDSSTPAPAQDTLAAPKKVRRQKLLLGAAAVCLALAVGLALYNNHRVKQLEWQVGSLQSQIMSVQSSLSSQIAGISSSVREAMEESATLTAQFDYTVKRFDLDAYTCTVAFALQPKTVQDDLAVSLRLRSLASDDGTTAVELVRDEYDVYRGETVLSMNDDGFEATAAYDTGGERQLETIRDLPGFADDEKRLHGVVVALGVLMLLLVDGREGECRQLQDFNRTVNLPTCLQDVDITVDDVRRAAPEILRDADLEHYPYQVTEDMLVRAAEKLAS